MGAHASVMNIYSIPRQTAVTDVEMVLKYAEAH
jgi:hypothetical protein